MNKAVRTISLTFAFLLFIFQMPVYSEEITVVDVTKEIWNVLHKEQKKEIKDKAVEGGKEVTFFGTINPNLINKINFCIEDLYIPNSLFCFQVAEKQA